MDTIAAAVLLHAVSRIAAIATATCVLVADSRRCRRQSHCASSGLPKSGGGRACIPCSKESVGQDYLVRLRRGWDGECQQEAVRDDGLSSRGKKRKLEWVSTFASAGSRAKSGSM